MLKTYKNTVEIIMIFLCYNYFLTKKKSSNMVCEHCEKMSKEKFNKEIIENPKKNKV